MMAMAIAPACNMKDESRPFVSTDSGEVETNSPPESISHTETAAIPESCMSVPPGCERSVPCHPLGTLDVEDATGCCIVHGDLEMRWPRVSDHRLLDLVCLQEVTGTLQISDVALGTISIENLERVGNQLRIERVVAENLYFPKLAAVGNLILTSETIQDLSGMEALTQVPMMWIDAPSISSLTGLESALPSVTESFQLVGATDATDYNGMTLLPTVLGGGLAMYEVGNPDIPLLPVTGLAWFTLERTAFEDVDFLAGLAAFEGDGAGLYITDNPALTTLSALSSARGDVEDVILLNNPALTSLDGLGGVSSVSENVDIWSNPSLESVRLDGLSYVGGRLWISDVQNVTEISMPALEEVEDNFYWVGPDRLADLTGLDSLRRVGGYLVLLTDAHSLNGLGALEEADLFELDYNRSITDLTGLDSLRALGSAGLYLSQNSRLESTRGADALEFAGRIALVDNRSLVEIPFPSLTDVAVYVRIEDNPNLPTCQIDLLQEQLATHGSFPDFYVSDNGTDDPAACE